MFARLLSSTLLGIEAFPVEVEAHREKGNGGLIRIVGLPDGVLRESRERVRCAIQNSGFRIPEGNVVVSLAPADLPKTGSGFDLAVALAILAADHQIDPSALNGRLFLGELSLDGRLKPVSGVVSTALLCRKLGKLRMVVSAGTGENLVSEIQIEIAKSFREVVAALMGDHLLETLPIARAEDDGGGVAGLGDVRGQNLAKRAMEIAAAGGHNLLFVGPPGSGKSMLAERFRSLMPPLTREEQLEICRIHDMAYGGQNTNEREGARKIVRPFRAPHHSVSVAGLIGGGSTPLPGEISLAHRGVLFLDELPEFRREALEALRQPLEARKISVSRANRKLLFPADFTLITAMNPCPCGNRGQRRDLCRCTPPQIGKYLSKISGPILDRIDLQLWVQRVDSSELLAPSIEDPTEVMRARICRAVTVQRERNRGRFNSRIGQKDLEMIAPLESSAKSILLRALERLGLSARACSRTLRVSRTIADLEGSEEIRGEHIAEALSYRIQLRTE